MPRLSKAKKDVISCDKLRGSANRNYIRRFPNGATHPDEVGIFREIGKRTQGTETSKYLEEEKTKVIAPVVASERARAQTFLVTAREGL